LGDWATPVAPHYQPVCPAARAVRFFATDHLEAPRAWYNSSDTPGRLFGSHLQFCSWSVFLLRSNYFTDSLLANRVPVSTPSALRFSLVFFACFAPLAVRFSMSCHSFAALA